VKSRGGDHQAAFAWALLAPALLVLGVFLVYPAAYSFYLSVNEVDPFSLKPFFVGFDNYRELLASPDYWRSVRISFLFTAMTVIPSVGFSLAIAVALDSSPYLRSVFRTVFLAPVAISSAMAAMLWIFLFNPTAGYLNYALSLVGLEGPNWLGAPGWAIVGVAVATVWREMGFNVIFFLAGLSSIPLELREAAVIDGANRAQRFRHVVLPILSPTVFFVAVVSVINSFQSFGQIHILTAGGPAGSTNVLVYKLYRDAFQNFRTGFASAQAVLLFLLMLALTGVQFAVARRKVHYGG
jgi:sn-glycerol 3-phosphate transport system permease protein